MTAATATISSTAWFNICPARRWLKIIMECFVVIVGFLILAGAVNTSMVGSNGVLNRLAEDGVLTPWFQHPHKRFGTTHRLINLVAVLQLIVIIASLRRRRHARRSLCLRRDLVVRLHDHVHDGPALQGHARPRNTEVPLNIHKTRQERRNRSAHRNLHGLPDPGSAPR